MFNIRQYRRRKKQYNVTLWPFVYAIRNKWTKRKKRQRKWIFVTRKLKKTTNFEGEVFGYIFFFLLTWFFPRFIFNDFFSTLTASFPKCLFLMFTMISAAGAMKVLSKAVRSPWNVQTSTSRACLMSISLKCPFVASQCGYRWPRCLSKRLDTEDTSYVDDEDDEAAATAAWVHAKLKN